MFTWRQAAEALGKILLPVSGPTDAIVRIEESAAARQCITIAMTQAPAPRPWNNEEERLRVLQRMRSQLKGDGVLAQGILSPTIEASWRRSLSYGLEPDEVLQTDCKPAADRNAELLRQCAEPELEFLARQYAEHGALVLADAHAQVLRTCGSLGCGDQACIEQVREGFIWSESLRGTNALGTSLVHQQPIWINSGEHFLDGLAHLSCAAVPIRDARGRLAGILDLTREGPLRNPRDSINMLMLSASQIEGRLLCATHGEHLVLAVHSRRPYLESAWRGLLAVDGQGRIQAANEQACSLLGRTQQQLSKLECEALLDLPFETLLSRLGQADVLEQAHGHTQLYLRCVQWPLALRPHQGPGARSRSRPSAARAPAGRPSPAAELEPRLQTAVKALNAGVPILLQGETGCGKEVAARALHARCLRARMPFVAINCAAIPEGLMEAELFGYREGAFTGARRGGAPGRLLQAQGGVLFLDEIGDMPQALQARLLRVLQERKIMPLGSTMEVDLDVLLICASHRNLQELTALQQFRQDLFYRINGLSLRLPALRERTDFVALAHALAQRIAGCPVPISEALLRLLQSHDWPGNIRELEMVLRTALALREQADDTLGPEHLSEGFMAQLGSTGSAAEAGPAPAANRLQALQAQALTQALKEHNGNATAAARSLGMSRATLYRKLRQYGC